jgi:heme exporter protein CcmD
MSVSEFFYMGGFGLFIWSSVGVTFALMAIEIIVVKKQHGTISKRLTRMLRMNKKVDQ